MSQDLYVQLGQLGAGAGSGAITKTSIAPLERVKILQQIQGMHCAKDNKYSGIVNTLRIVVKEEGLLALYKGNGANVARIIPNYALKFSFNDTFKEMVRFPDQTGPLLPYQLMASGSAAGLVQITTTYPLEVLRTRLSLADALKQQQGVEYLGIRDCAVKTVRMEGYSALYKGITPTWLSGIPYVGLQMTAFEMFKRVFPTNADGRSSVFWTLTAGAMSGVCAQTITYPGDTVRRRMQTDGIGGSARIYSSMTDTIRLVIKKEGIGAFYKGLSANVVRCIPGAAIQFWAYDLLKGYLVPN